MKIYTYPRSRSLRVLWALEESGIDYQTIPVDLFNPESGTGSPHSRRKVPFMEDGAVAIEETMAICLYLCEKYSAMTLYPSESQQKARVNAWISFALTDLESPVWNLVKLLVYVPEEQRQSVLVDYFRQEAQQVVNTIQFSHGEEWIAGAGFSLADIFMAHTLQWAKLCGIMLSPEISEYLDRALSRSAYLRAQERNNQQNIELE